MRTTNQMALGMILVLGLTMGVVSAQVQQSTVPLSTSPELNCLTSGAADQFIKVCYTSHGNIVRFESPAGKEHIRIGNIEEGYAVCYGANQVAYDAAIAEANWGPPAISPDKKTITRMTIDGKLLLKQTFSLDPTEKDVQIKVEVKNVSANPVWLIGIARYFDGDIDNSILNIWDRTSDSVFARKENGLSLTAVSDFPVTAVEIFGLRHNSCAAINVLGNPPSPSMDLAGRVYLPLFYNLAPGKFEAATFVYRRN